jgi:hypothetical protein
MRELSAPWSAVQMSSLLCVQNVSACLLLYIVVRLCIFLCFVEQFLAQASLDEQMDCSRTSVVMYCLAERDELCEIKTSDGPAVTGEAPFKLST